MPPATNDLGWEDHLLQIAEQGLDGAPGAVYDDIADFEWLVSLAPMGPSL